MRNALVFLVALLIAGPVHAGTEAANLSWNGCTSAVQEKSFTGPGLYAMTATVSGSARTILGYELQVEIQDPLAECQRGTFPRAWEFEGGGCNAGHWSVETTPGPGCASLGSVTGIFTVYEQGYYPASRRIRMEILLGQPVTLEADKTYHLATITFDHGNSSVASPDSCTGAGEPICIYLSAANWIDAQSQTGPWNTFTPGLSWNPDAGFYGCPFLCDAAVPKSWGSLKASYR